MDRLKDGISQRDLKLRGMEKTREDDREIAVKTKHTPQL